MTDVATICTEDDLLTHVRMTLLYLTKADKGLHKRVVAVPVAELLD